MFLSWSMNGSTSKLAMEAIVLMDVVESVLSLHDVNQALSQISAFHDDREVPVSLLAGAGTSASVRRARITPSQLRPGSSIAAATSRAPTPYRTANKWRCVHSSPDEPASMASSSPKTARAAVSKLSSTQIGRTASASCHPSRLSSGDAVEDAADRVSTLTSVKPATANDQQFLEHYVRLLYTTDFVLLIEYVEVMVPTVYSLYLVGAYHLPNHVDLSNLRDLSPDDLRHNVTTLLIYSSIEFVLLLMFGALLQSRTRVSALRQLVFVLESQWKLVQALLIFWIVFAVQTPLEHYGNDFSFRFEWLKHDNSMANEQARQGK